MKKHILLILFLLNVITGFSQNGTCLSPNLAYDDSVSFDGEFGLDVNKTVWGVDGNLPTYWSVNSSSSSSLGIVCDLPESCKKNISFSLYAPGDCDGTPIIPTITKGKNDSLFNPEWLGLLPEKNYILKISPCNASMFMNVIRYDACVDPRFSIYVDKEFSQVYSGTNFSCVDDTVYLAPQNYQNSFIGKAWPQVRPGAGWPFPGFKIEVTPDVGNFDNTLLKIYDASGNFVESTTLTISEPYFYFYFPNATGHTFAFDILNNSSNKFDYKITDLISGNIIKTGSWIVTNGQESSKSDLCIPTGIGKFECKTCSPGSLIQGIGPNNLNNQGIATFIPQNAGSGIHTITYMWDNNFNLPHCIDSFSITVSVNGAPDKPLIDSVKNSSCDIPNGTVKLKGLPNTPWIIKVIPDSGSSTTLSGNQNAITITNLAAFKKYIFLVQDASSGCSSEVSDSVYIDGILPLSPSISGDDSICFGSSALLKASSSQATNYKWYNSSNSSEVIFTGENFNTGKLFKDTVFYAEAIAGPCKSISKDSFSIKIKALDSTAFSYPFQTFCRLDSVLPKPMPKFQGGLFSCSNLDLILNTSTGMINLAKSPAKSYTIKYTSNGNCPNTDSVTVNIIETPQEANFSYASDKYCKKDEIITPVITNGSFAGKFSFSPLGLNMDSTGAINPSKSMAGKYAITNSVNSITCHNKVSFVDSLIILALPNAPILEDLNIQTTYCAIDKPKIDTLFKKGLIWYDAPNKGNIILSGTPIQNMQKYYVSQTDSISGCESADRLAVEIKLNDSIFVANNQNPTYCLSNQVTIDTLKTLFNQGSILNWYADLNSNIKLNANDILENNKTYYAAILNKGCESALRVAVLVTLDDVISPAISANSSTTVCKENQAKIEIENPQTNIQYLVYTTINSSTSIGSVPFTFTPLNDTILYIESINNKGCKQNSPRLPVLVKVNPNPNPPGVIARSTTICAKEKLTLNATSSQPNISYSWSGPNNFKSSEKDPVVSLNADTSLSGIYHVMVTDNKTGCKSLKSDSIHVKIKFVQAGFNTASNAGFTPFTVNYSNSSVNADKYYWNIGREFESTEKDISLTFEKEGTYKIYLVAYNGTCSDTLYGEDIDVKKSSELEIANVFTPNNDGKNDVFNVKGIGLKSLNCKIFNRWGELIYEWETLNGGWTGRTIAGDEVSDGVYFYIIEAKGNDLIPYKKHGYIDLIR